MAEPLSSNASTCLPLSVAVTISRSPHVTCTGIVPRGPLHGRSTCAAGGRLPQPYPSSGQVDLDIIVAEHVATDQSTHGWYVGHYEATLKICSAQLQVRVDVGIADGTSDPDQLAHGKLAPSE